MRAKRDDDERGAAKHKIDTQDDADDDQHTA